MWRVVIGGAAIGTLLLVGVYLLSNISGDAPERSRAEANAPARPSSAARPVSLPITRTSQPQTSSPASESAESEYNPLVKDPKGTYRTLGFIGKDLGSPAAKVDAIRASVIESGACSDAICAKTKDAMRTRIEAVSRAVKGTLTAKSVECYQVGCIVDVSVPMAGGNSLGAAIDRLQGTGDLDWPVPAMYSIPTISNGTQTAMWVLFNPASY